MAAIFSDERYLAGWIQVECALARAQGKLGVIPAQAAERIVSEASRFECDLQRLSQRTAIAGFPVIGLLEQLRGRFDENTAQYLHWGATTQDVMDTGLVLQLRDAMLLIDRKLIALIGNLVRLAEQHRNTLMAGRTHTQHALPIPFALKVAGWLSPLLRHKQRLSELLPRLLVVQLGGAVGTLAALGSQGLQVQRQLAQELDLGVPLSPWHTQRDNLCETAGWLSLVSSSLAKMAQDVLLMAQSEVAELLESAEPDQGGSSTMPQKRNPIKSELVVAAARSNAALLGTMHQASIQEHERASHGWQSEWLALPQMFGLTSGALFNSLFVSDHLVVRSERMSENVRSSQGLMLGEAVIFALAPTLGLLPAKRLVSECCQTARQENRHLIDVVKERSEVPLDWSTLKDESRYLGSSQEIIDRVLRQASKVV